MPRTDSGTGGSQAAARPPARPEPSVRAERVLVNLDKGWTWLDGQLAKLCPAEMNPLARSGQAANFALIQAVISGILLLFWYSPSVQFAYSSIENLQGHTLGGFVRAAHRYSSDLVMLLLFIHATRMLFARKFAGARWLPWVSGVFLMALVWFIGWTGFWLVWDQPAQQVAVTSVKLLDTLPVWAEPLGRSFLANRLVPSLLFFVIFFLHMLLPLGIALGLVIHLLRLSRVKLLPDWRLAAAMTVGLLLAAALVPAPLDAEADMSLRPESFTVDAWYLTPLALGLRFRNAGLWLALFGTLAVCAAIPWILGRRRKQETYQAQVEVSRCHSCSQCVNDCPFDAVSLVPRTDGKRFPAQASVDPSKCVGCGVCNGSCDSAGIGLTWFDNLVEESRILETFTRNCESQAPSWIAFIPGDLEGGMPYIHADRWRDRLPGYQTFLVPTASWVRSSFVEQLLKTRAEGVLIIRDARPEAFARDGNRWVSDRLEGIRSPAFRPERAQGANQWKVVDYNPADEPSLIRTAEDFRKGVKSQETPRSPAPLWKSLAASLLLMALLTAAAVVPSHLKVENPAPSDPEIVVAFKALGDLVTQEAPMEEDLSKPIHMRGRSTEKPHRADVRVRIWVDGQLHEDNYAARGISHDGPALGEWRSTVAEGPHTIKIEILTGEQAEPKTWSGTLEAERRSIQVITYNPGAGFRVEN